MAYGTRKREGNVNGTGYRGLDEIGNDPRCESIDDEGRVDRGGDGIWTYTVDGFCNGDIGSHIVHEDTVRALRSAWKNVRPCDCESCGGTK